MLMNIINVPEHYQSSSTLLTLLNIITIPENVLERYHPSQMLLTFLNVLNFPERYHRS